jgi:hypothetical protein
MKTILFEEVKRINELMGLDSNIIVETNIFTELLKRDARKSLYNLGKVLKRPLRSVDEIVEADIPTILRSTSKAADEFKSMIVKAWGISADEFESKTTQELIQDLSTLGVRDGKDIIRIIKKASSDLGVEPKGGLPKPKGGGATSLDISRTTRELDTTPTELVTSEPNLEEIFRKLDDMLDDAKVAIPKSKKTQFLSELQKKIAERMESLNKQYSSVDIENLFNDPNYAKTVEALNRLPVDKRREMITNLKNTLGKNFKTGIEKLKVSADVKKLLSDSWEYFFNDILLGKQFWVKDKNWFTTFGKWYLRYVWRTEKWFLAATLENVVAAISDADGATMESLFGSGKELGAGAAKSVMSLIPFAGPLYAGGSFLNATVNMLSSGVSYIKRQATKRDNLQTQDGVLEEVVNLTKNEATNFVENQDGLKNNLPKDISEYSQIEYKEVTGSDGKSKIQVWLDGINTVTLEKRKTIQHPIDGEVKIVRN